MEDLPALSNEAQLYVMGLVKRGVPPDQVLAKAHAIAAKERQAEIRKEEEARARYQQMCAGKPTKSVVSRTATPPAAPSSADAAAVVLPASATAVIGATSALVGGAAGGSSSTNNKDGSGRASPAGGQLKRGASSRSSSHRLLASVRGKINHVVQTPPGFCVNCGMKENRGVTRACRACGNVYCGTCKGRFMEKSDIADMPKKRRWLCKQDSCRQNDPDRAPSPPVPRRRPLTSKVPCELCGKPVFNVETARDYRTRMFHRNCLKCVVCLKLFSDSEPYEWLQGKLFCSHQHSRCFEKAADPRHNSVTINQPFGPKRPSTSTILASGDGQPLVESFASELQSADKGANRCETCGACVRMSQLVVADGDSVRHKHCHISGRAMYESDMTPAIAADALPDTLCLCLTINDHRVYFFLSTTGEPTADAATGNLTVPLEVNPLCKAPDEREFEEHVSPFPPKLAVRGCGEHSAGFVAHTPPVFDPETGIVAATLHLRRFGLDHDLAVNFACSKQCVSVMGASLVVINGTSNILDPASGPQARSRSMSSARRRRLSAAAEAVEAKDDVASQPNPSQRPGSSSSRRRKFSSSSLKADAAAPPLEQSERPDRPDRPDPPAAASEPTAARRSRRRKFKNTSVNSSPASDQPEAAE